MTFSASFRGLCAALRAAPRFGSAAALPALALATALVLVGCATAPEPPPSAQPVPTSPAAARALIAKVLPPSVRQRRAWASDIHASFASLEIAPSIENICAVVAVTDQESNFRVDPPVPGLASIAWKEIDRQCERVGVPWLVLQAALLIPSPNGRSYSERIDTVKTEQLALALDGDLLRYERGEPARDPGSTELATRVLAKRLDLSFSQIRRDLGRERSIDFEKTRLYARVFALGERVSGTTMPRAVLPRIRLKSPKITRRLTTEWFANRVEARYRRCIAAR